MPLNEALYGKAIMSNFEDLNSFVLFSSDRPPAPAPSQAAAQTAHSPLLLEAGTGRCHSRARENGGIGRTRRLGSGHPLCQAGFWSAKSTEVRGEG